MHQVEDSLRGIQKKSLWPIIKLGEEMTYSPWEAIPTKVVTIRATDLFCENGKSTKPIFKEIEDAGGIHKYLTFEGKIVLSSIMPDKMIRGVTKEEYAEMIDGLGVDYYFTPDGETYLGELYLGAYEINRVLDETKYLLKNCKSSSAIGLVKGGNTSQVCLHIRSLKQEGITEMVFHAADFLRGARENEAGIGVNFAKIIRENANKFYVYGIGSRNSLRLFQQADCFITQNHFINAFYRQEMRHGKWQHARKKADRKQIMRNLESIYTEVERFGKVQKLDRWLHTR